MPNLWAAAGSCSRWRLQRGPKERDLAAKDRRQGTEVMVDVDKVSIGRNTESHECREIIFFWGGGITVTTDIDLEYSVWLIHELRLDHSNVHPSISLPAFHPESRCGFHWYAVLFATGARGVGGPLAWNGV